MPNTEEQRLDLIENCTLLLEGILKPFNQTDNTAEGRMITQCQWFKERAENHDLPLPVKKGKLGSLLYIYTNGELFTASSKNEEIRRVEMIMKRIIRLTKKAQLLMKPPYAPYALRSIDALITLLETSPRPLDQYEQGLISELKQLKQLLAEGKVEPPLMTYLPEYPNFNKIDGLIRYKPKAYAASEHQKKIAKMIADLLFEGVRPDTWLTPEDADRETQNL